MRITVAELRRNANAAPMFADILNASADEIERLNAAIETWGDVDLKGAFTSEDPLDNPIAYKKVKPRHCVAQTTQSEFETRVLVEKTMSPELSGFLLTDHHKLITENAALKEEIEKLKSAYGHTSGLWIDRGREITRLQNIIKGMKDLCNA